MCILSAYLATNHPDKTQAQNIKPLQYNKPVELSVCSDDIEDDVMLCRHTINLPGLIVKVDT